MNPRVTGLVTNVKDFKKGSDLASASVAGDTIIEVESFEDFRLGGGQLQIGSEIHTYTFGGEGVLDQEDNNEILLEDFSDISIENDTTTYSLVLSAPLASDYSDQEPVLAYPLRSERVAFLQENGNDEELEAVVPPEYWDRLPLGTREPGDAQLVTCRREGSDLVVRHVRAETPSVDPEPLDIEDNTEFFERLRTLMLSTNTLYVGVEFDDSNPPVAQGQRLEFDEEGIRLYKQGQSSPTAELNAGDGSVDIEGVFEFGQGSKLERDVLELQEQPTSLQVPALVQSKVKVGGPVATLPAIIFNTPTVAGNLVLLAVWSTADIPAHAAAPAGWTKVATSNGTSTCLSLYARTASGALTQTPTIALGPATSRYIAQAYEYEGVQLSVGPAANKDNNANDSATLLSGQTASAPLGSLVLAFFGGVNVATGDDAFHSPQDGFVEVRETINPTGGFGVVGGALAGFSLIAPSTAVQEAEVGAKDALNRPTAVIGTFPAKVATGDPDTPAADKLRIYAQDGNDGSEPWYIDEDGDTFPWVPRHDAEVVTFSGTAAESLAGISHGLSAAPSVIVATCDSTLGVGSPRCIATVGNIGASTFSISVRTNDDSFLTGDVTVRWIALA